MRGGWSPKEPESPDEITSYVGGGLTAHAFIGIDNSIGLGFGWAHSETVEETFVELFFKLREIAWLTFEPNVQIYFTPDHTHVAFGIRTKLKL